MPRTAAVLLAALLVAACGETANESVPPGFKSMIDELAAQHDCASLQARFDDAHETAELKYADRAMRDADCY